ncbi:MAG: spore cortex biosynthesis protein YabQ [Oscillospiraceae bacterium]|nr:spore cortex biosynthesis protein YabQ [Oscillospiraceae bacterium]
MNVTDIELLWLLGYSVLLGILLALAYDIFTFFRMLLTSAGSGGAVGRMLSDAVTFVFDILYALFSGICVVLLFFGVNSGRVRLIGLFGCAIGFCLYRYTLGILTRRAVLLIVLPLQTFICKVWRASAGKCFGHLRGRAVALCRKNKNKRNSKRKEKKKGTDRVENEKLEFFG